MKWDAVCTWCVHGNNGTHKNSKFQAFVVMNVGWTNFFRKIQTLSYLLTNFHGNLRPPFFGLLNGTGCVLLMKKTEKSQYSQQWDLSLFGRAVFRKVSLGNLFGGFSLGQSQQGVLKYQLTMSNKGVFHFFIGPIQECLC